jgi:hypothetical protein
MAYPYLRSSLAGREADRPAVLISNIGGAKGPVR